MTGKPPADWTAGWALLAGLARTGRVFTVNDGTVRDRLRGKFPDTSCDGRSDVDHPCDTGGTSKEGPMVRQTPPGLTSTAITGRRPLSMMLRQSPDEQARPRGYAPRQAATIPRLDRHWYVQDATDESSPYCVACGLPATNRRHVERAA